MPPRRSRRCTCGPVGRPEPASCSRLRTNQCRQRETRQEDVARESEPHGLAKKMVELVCQLIVRFSAAGPGLHHRPAPTRSNSPSFPRLRDAGAMVTTSPGSTFVADGRWCTAPDVTEPKKQCDSIGVELKRSATSLRELRYSATSDANTIVCPSTVAQRLLAKAIPARCNNCSLRSQRARANMPLNRMRASRTPQCSSPSSTTSCQCPCGTGGLLSQDPSHRLKVVDLAL